MKPIPAIVEPAPVDIDAAAEHIIVALAGEQDAVRSATRHEQLGQAARETAALRRREVGSWLAKVRPSWPASGPRARGWSEFIARVKLDDSTAVRYMREARGGMVHGDGPCTSSPQDSAHERGVSQTPDDDEPIEVQGRPRDVPPFRQLSEDDIVQALARLDPEARKRVLKSGKVNLQGNSGDVERGTWTTSEKWARAIGQVELDPFSNPRSKIASVHRCMLEDGGDGFGGGEPGEPPGLYLLGDRHGSRTGIATAETTTFFQWPYSPGFAERAIAHYGHTRFRALLRWSPDTAWFRMLWPLVSTIAIPQERIEFDPPPGVAKPDSTISYPHTLYYANWRDVTDEVRALCIVISIDHSITDPREIQRALIAASQVD